MAAERAEYLCVSYDFGCTLISNFYAVEATSLSIEFRRRSIELLRRPTVRRLTLPPVALQ
jgi:hypothetical protein